MEKPKVRTVGGIAFLIAVGVIEAVLAETVRDEAMRVTQSGIRVAKIKVKDYISAKAKSNER